MQSFGYGHGTVTFDCLPLRLHVDVALVVRRRGVLAMCYKIGSRNQQERKQLARMEDRVEFRQLLKQ